MTWRKRASWRARAVRIASGCCSQRVVLPSISVKRNVTLPVGRLGMESLLVWHLAVHRLESACLLFDVYPNQWENASVGTLSHYTSSVRRESQTRSFGSRARSHSCAGQPNLT